MSFVPLAPVGDYMWTSSWTARETLSKFEFQTSFLVQLLLTPMGGSSGELMGESLLWFYLGFSGLYRMVGMLGDPVLFERKTTKADNVPSSYVTLCAVMSYLSSRTNAIVAGMDVNVEVCDTNECVTANDIPTVEYDDLLLSASLLQVSRYLSVQEVKKMAAMQLEGFFPSGGFTECYMTKEYDFSKLEKGSACQLETGKVWTEECGTRLESAKHKNEHEQSMPDRVRSGQRGESKSVFGIAL
ncbi:hypothetical protein POM88_004190 [Heracleum sosnowskyi]|uniref:Uncharacterized protein n=1 Tax=Heracleum sosnowskyi TaxID=360622 RepID=A0AAD8JHC9_9APIA|nr:hypothetical protein POM88_004190 [Heracleum sosnowskyi]